MSSQSLLVAAKNVVSEADQHGGGYPQYPELHAAIDHLRDANRALLIKERDPTL